MHGGALPCFMADSATLSPQQAAQALADIAGYEEGLTARVGGLTCMVWGIVSAAIFVTYGVAADVHPMWIMGFLWLPWTAAGIAVTAAAWKLHALTFKGGDSQRRSWLWSLGFAVLFFVAILLLHALDLGDGAFPYMLVVNGLVAFLIVAGVSRRRGRLTAIPLLVGGVLLVGGAFAIAAANLPMLAMSFASATLVGVCYVGAGLSAFVRG